MFVYAYLGEVVCQTRPPVSNTDSSTWFSQCLRRQANLHYTSHKGKEAKMIESTITAKGQTTVPVKVRDQIGAGPGTRLVWHVLPDSSVIVRAKTKSILDLAGVL